MSKQEEPKRYTLEVQSTRQKLKDSNPAKKEVPEINTLTVKSKMFVTRQSKVYWKVNLIDSNNQKHVIEVESKTKAGQQVDQQEAERISKITRDRVFKLAEKLNPVGNVIEGNVK